MSRDTRHICNSCGQPIEPTDVEYAGQPQTHWMYDQKCPPECPYWEDGRHCYEVSHSERWEMGGVMMGGGVIKTCRCGAAVEPRE